MVDTRFYVELALPPRLFLAVANGKTFSCFDSVGRVTNVGAFEELLTVRSQLTQAIVEALMPLPSARWQTAYRYVDRASDAALIDLEGQPAAKSMRAISWWLANTIGEGKVELWAGSPADLAITKMMDWTENTFDLLKPRVVDAMDASAQKQARRLGDRLRGMGYFG